MFFDTNYIFRTASEPTKIELVFSNPKYLYLSDQQNAVMPLAAGQDGL